MNDDTKFVYELAHQLIACGAPVDQFRLTMRALNPEITISGLSQPMSAVTWKQSAVFRRLIDTLVAL